MDSLLSSILWEITANTYYVQYLVCGGICLCTLNVLIYLILTGTRGGVYFLIPSLQMRRLRHRGEVTCQESRLNQWWGGTMFAELLTPASICQVGEQRHLHPGWTRGAEAGGDIKMYISLCCADGCRLRWM